MDYPKLTQEAIVFYRDRHFSAPMVARVFGVSAKSVYRYLNKNGVDTSTGKTYSYTCEVCGGQGVTTRARVRREEARFCSRACYYEFLRQKNPKAFRSQYHMKLARKIVREFFDMKEGYIVHHEDGDNRNNRVDNLKVFKNQREHLRYHRAKEGMRPEPLWEGSRSYG